MFKKTILIMMVLVVSLWGVHSASAQPLPGGTLDPLTIPQFVTPLVIPPEMPLAGPNSYEIALRQFPQQILPTGFPLTTVWSYGNATDPTPDGATIFAGSGTSFHYPAFTIEATAGIPTQVRWINELVAIDPDTHFPYPVGDPNRTFLPHLLPVDQTLHWANPPQTCVDMMGNPFTGTDCRGSDPAPYTGPVPMVAHLHGSHVDPHSDGYPEAWWLPDAFNIIPAGYATQGTHYSQAPGATPVLGEALYSYRNDQRATTLWFHDHSLGMTRLNVYAGPAGFYILRGGPSDVVINNATKLPATLPSGPYEIPIVVQDRSFNANGDLFYATSRSFFDGFAGPYIPTNALSGLPSDVSPIWNPEFFGNMMVVNGKTWPYLNVEPRRYRFRFLNGCDSRFLILKFDKKLNFTQIGTEGGFLPAPVVLNQLLMGLAERADVIVDFSAFAPGTVITLLNVGPDSPFGGLPVPKSLQADPATTGKVMQFVVGPGGPDTTTNPANYVFPKLPKLGRPNFTRQVSLNEMMSATVCVDANNVEVPCNTKGAVPLAPISAMLGTVDAAGLGVPKMWMDPISETIGSNAIEQWEIFNFTVDAHPIHVHQVMFQVVNRQVMGGPTRGPEPWETGYKDTVIAYPGEITRIKALFDIDGLYVWHCHILSHEDNEMMRPFCVGPLASCQ